MRYLVRACIKPGREQSLLRAVEDRSLGRGSVAEGEYLRNMADARLCADGTARWVEVCYCPTPLQEERPYWEEYFDRARRCTGTRTYAEFPGRCPSGGEHDVAGPPYMLFSEKGSLVIDARTCSKCGSDNVP